MSSMPTRTIGNSQVGVMGYGLMNMTWKPEGHHTSDEQAFKAIKTAVDGGSNFLNSGEFYGTPDRELNLKLLARFFAANPSYESKVYLSVKGAITPQFKPDSSTAYLRESVININRVLASEGSSKKMDLFEPARVDTTRKIEDTMKDLMALVEEGHFKDIGLSECGAETIRRAAAVGKIGAVEVEYSPWSMDIEENGVMDACKELKIPIVTYSPLGKGFLTGSIKSRADIPEGDMRLTFDRFSEENFPKNLELVKKLEVIAEKKGISTTKLALAWNVAQCDLIVPIPGSTRPEGVQEAIDSAQVKLTEEELKEIRNVIKSFKVTGGRYNKHSEHTLAK